MSERERVLADVTGAFTAVRGDGFDPGTVDWTTGRILLSSERLVLATGDDREMLSLARITDVTARDDVDLPSAGVSRCLGLALGDDRVLVAPNTEAFHQDLFRALLNGEFVLVRHTAGTTDADGTPEWVKARLKVDQHVLNVATVGGTFLELDFEDVSDHATTREPVGEQERPVVQLTHTADEGSVETHVTGPERYCSLLKSLCSWFVAVTDDEERLDEQERAVLTALQSGVPPLQVPTETDLDVDTVESIFDHLVERDVLEEVRRRREVTLTSRGRSVASEASKVE